MRLAVDLDGKPLGRAEEVQDVGSDRVLPTEAGAKLPVPENRPESSLGRTHGAAQCSGSGAWSELVEVHAEALQRSDPATSKCSALAHGATPLGGFAACAPASGGTEPSVPPLGGTGHLGRRPG